MKLFGPLYARALRWAAHPKAPWLLFGLSIIEAVIFPVAPEVMLAPMALSKPKRAFWFASISLLGSIIGAVIGYTLGHYAFELIKPLFVTLGWMDAINAKVVYLQHLAAESPWKMFWVLVGAGFLPIPLKIFTWAGGIAGLPLPAFLASMTVGRGKRVFLVAGAIRIGGERAEAALRRWIEPVGWVVMALFLGVVGWLVWRGMHG